jgi:hypothetical protein
MTSCRFSTKVCGVVTVLATVALLLVTHNPTAAQVTILNFEDFPPRTRITSQYSARGILFPFGAFLDTDPAARSGTRVLRAGGPPQEFHPAPFIIEFTSGQTRVRLFAGVQGFNVPVKGTLRVFDGGGALLAQDGPKPVPPATFTTAFGATVAGPLIRRLELEIEGAAFEAIDDLEFEGESPADLPTTPPVVQITQPSNGAELTTSALMLRGTVTGEGLLPVAHLTWTQGLPPDSTAPPSVSGLALEGSGTTRTFALEIGVGLGPQVMTVEVENRAGLKGRMTVRFVSLPEPIRNRFATEGGAATFGALRYGGGAGGCRMAVYQQGAIAVSGTTTFVVRGAIFSKWFSLRDQGAPLARLGCPTGEARDAVGGTRAQDFTQGRIYAGLPSGTYYVPAVFVQAIDQRGGEAATGVPLGDPIESLGSPIWLFQRFYRPDWPGWALPSTLEIRGTPPTLWMERQGGDKSPLFFPGGSVSATSPTIWEQFPCSGNRGPCAVAPPASPPPVQDPGRFCGHALFLQPELSLNSKLWTLEWAPIVGDYELTPILGIVSDAHLAGEDFPATHSCHVGDPLSDPGSWLRSDMNVHVRPLYGYRHLFADNTEDIELEYEICWFHYAFAAGLDPIPGDLLFASGRWIIDCGHKPYNSEIHPPAVMASMRTTKVEGWPATQANVWVNGIYTGDPVEFEIFPPPRPSPDAILNIRKPRDSAAYGLNLEPFYSALGYVRLRFTAPLRHVEVSSMGEMKMESGRGYHGIWHLYWTD